MEEQAEAFEGRTVRMQPVCPMCGSAMETGFVRDRGDSDINHQSEWVAGEPQKRSRWLGGLKLGRARRYAMTTFRCEACGFLTAYATTPLNDVQPT